MLLLIPLLPFFGFLVNASFGRRLTTSISGGVACLAIIASFVVSLTKVLGMHAAAGEHAVRQIVFTWLASGHLQIPFEIYLDPPSSLMILVVTGIGSLDHIFSAGYMH